MVHTCVNEGGGEIIINHGISSVLGHNTNLVCGLDSYLGGFFFG